MCNGEYSEPNGGVFDALKKQDVIDRGERAINRLKAVTPRGATETDAHIPLSEARIDPERFRGPVEWSNTWGAAQAILAPLGWMPSTRSDGRVLAIDPKTGARCSPKLALHIEEARRKGETSLAEQMIIDNRKRA